MTYERLHAGLLAALVHEDPMELDGPGNDLEDEYDAEAREIARRLVREGADPDAEIVATAIGETFEESFGTPLPASRVARMAAAQALGEPGLGDVSARLGDAPVVAAFVRALVAAHGRRAVVTVETDAGGRSSVLLTAPPGEDGGTEPLTIELLGPGDGEVWVRSHLIELGAGDLGRHQPLREPVSAIEQLVVAIVTGDVRWDSVVRRRDDVMVSEEVCVFTAGGSFEIHTSFGSGRWGRTRRIYGAAAPYPRQARGVEVEDEGDTSGGELWGCHPDVSGLTIRDGAVRIPVRREVRIGRCTSTTVERPDVTMVIAPATAVEVHDPHGQPWFPEFDGLQYGPGGAPEVRIDGVPGIRVTVRGHGTTTPRVRLEPPSAAETDPDRPAVAVTVTGPDGSPETFADIDAARLAFQNRKVEPGTYDGHDADGYRVSIVVADVSAPWRRRPRARRWLGLRVEVTSTTTAERVGTAFADEVRRLGPSE